MEYLTLQGFTGLNSHTSPFFLKEGQFPLGVNLSTDEVGVLKKKGGYSIRGAQITASQDGLGSIDFKRQDGTHEQVVAVDGSSNADIHIYNTGTDSFDAQSQSLTAASRVRFAYSPTLDELFAVNFDDATRVYNGSTWSTAGDVSGAPKAKHVLNFARRMWLGNVDISGTTNPDRVYFSNLVSSGSLSWDTTNDWIVIDDVVNALAKNRDNMLIFGKESLYVFTIAQQKYQLSSVGTSSPDSVATYKDWTLFANRDGVFATDTSDVQKISRPVQEFIDGIAESAFTNLYGETHKGHYYLWVSDLTSPETINNVVLDYDIEANNWNVLRLADNATDLHTFVTSSGSRIFFTNDDGTAYTLFQDDNQKGNDFTSYYEAPWLYGSGMRNKDSYRQIHVDGKNLHSLSIQYKVDDEKEFRTAGELDGANDIVRLRKRANKIKLRLVESSSAPTYEVYRIEVGFIPEFVKEKKTK